VPALVVAMQDSTVGRAKLDCCRLASRMYREAKSESKRYI
jgi:hypothetical protein